MGRVSPRYFRADHFGIYCRKIEAAVGGGLRLVFSAPPQHGKSETTLHGLVWLILRYPGKRHAYITYGQKRARSVARKVRRLLQVCGVEASGTLDMVQLPSGGQILFTSIDGGITGEPVDGLAIIDDPYKNRKEADSAARRATVLDSYREAIETRVHPGASILLLATRWHPHDLSGTLIAEGWESINLPALAEAEDPNGRAVGDALFPQKWPVDELEKKRAKVLEFTWAALYQGRPRPKGGKVFREPTYYSKLPTKYRGAFGVDLAYTARTSADWSICVEMWREETGDPKSPNFYIVHVDRKQCEAPEFSTTLKARSLRRPGWKMLWRSSGTEKGAAQFLQKTLPLVVQNPPGDKLVSATEVAAAWNEGRVFVPDPEAFADVPGFEDLDEWLYPFLDIVGNFTGMGKEVDDDVDGLGNAFEALNSETSMMSYLLGKVNQ
jgi:phage terminase large subunit-like protein